MTAVLDVQAISAGYGPDPVVKGVSFSIGQGEAVALIGRSGSGKSTILKAISALLPLKAGSVELRGQRIITAAGPHFAEWEIRRHIALVSQESSLFPHYSVRRNIAIGLEIRKSFSAAEIASRVEGMAVQLGLQGREGVDSLLERHPEELSGGQRQRVQLARSLLLQPDVLLLDEVTNGLDPHATADLLDAIVKVRKLNPTLSIVVVSHFIGFIKSFADRVYYLSEGSIRDRADSTSFFGGFVSDEANAFVASARRHIEHDV